MFTLLAAGSGAAMKEHPTIKELVESFSNFIPKGTIALLAALFPALF